jgi:putative transposase
MVPVFYGQSGRSGYGLREAGIFNYDQESQLTSDSFANVRQKKDINTSVNSRGQALDNIFIERLWRTVKYEDVYLSKN